MQFSDFSLTWCLYIWCYHQNYLFCDFSGNISIYLNPLVSSLSKPFRFLWLAFKSESVSSLLWVADEVASLSAWVLSLTVPEEQEENADWAPLGNLLAHACRNRVAQNDSQWEVSLWELHHREAREANESSWLEHEGAQIGVVVKLPWCWRVWNDRQVVSVGITVQFLQVFSLSDIWLALTVELTRLFIESVQLVAWHWSEVHCCFHK